MRLVLQGNLGPDLFENLAKEFVRGPNLLAHVLLASDTFSLERSRQMRIAMFAVVGMAGLIPAVAQDVTAAIIARSYSTNFFMRTECAAFIRVDVAEAGKVGARMLLLGNRKFGAAVMRPLVDAEIEHRRAEVVASGISAWCDYQRARMQASGVTTIFR